MSASDLRKKDEAELKAELLETLKEQFNLRMQQGTGQLARPHLMREARRKVARIKTLIRERAETKA